MAFFENFKKLGALKRRKLFCILTGVLAAFLVCALTSIIGLIVFVVCLLIGMIALLPFRNVRWIAGLMLLPAMLGCLYYFGYYGLVYRPVKRFEGQTVTITGRLISEVKESANSDYYLLHPESIRLEDREERIAGSVMVYFEKDSVHFPIGARVVCMGTAFENGQADDLRVDTQMAERRFLSVYAESNVKIGNPRKYDIYVWTQKLRDAISDSYDRIFSKEVSAFLQGLTLGQRDVIESEVYYDFKDAGVSHVLAVSGMHLAFLTGILWAVLSVLPLGLRLRSVIQIFAVWAFATVTGFSPSCCRAAIMLTIYHIGVLKNVESDSLTSLALAVWLYCMFNPFAILSPSLLLSATATLGILLLSPRIDMALRFGKPKFTVAGKLYRMLKNALILSVSAMLFTMPVLALMFQTVSLISPITNVLIVLPIQLLFILGFCAMLFCRVTPLYPVFYRIGQMLYGYCKTVTGFLSDLPISVIYSGSIRFLVFIVLMAAGAVILYRFAGKWKGPCILALYVVLLFGEWGICYLPNDTVTAYFVEAGQGNTTVIADGEHAILIDCGGSGTGARAIDRVLLKAGVRRIDTIYFTHLDIDHIRYTLNIMDKYRVSRLALPNYTELSAYAGSMLYQIRRKGIPVELIDGNMTEEPFENIQLRIYAEHIDAYGNSENNNSLVYKFTYGKNDILFMGDLETKGEQQLLDYADVTCDIIEVSHHGSANGSSEELLHAIGARVAVISVGADNRYGLPSPYAIRRLNGSVDKIYRTDYDGTIAIRMDADEYRIRKGY